MMKAETKALRDGVILYDAEQADKINDHVFTPSYWRTRGSLSDPLGGRGAAWRITDDTIAGDTVDWVLRLYRRGGMVGCVILDWYFYTGLQRTRPFREWHLTAGLHDLGLPVPRPVAARVIRGAFGYRGGLITETVPGMSLAALLRDGLVSDAAWQAVGVTIRRFHDAGAWHADLNAHNILVAGADRNSSDASPIIHLIDFDRGRIRKPDIAWREANLARLQRSLAKVAPEPGQLDTVKHGWQLLEAGYRNSTGS
jgi:3-deoxy-D-manno-octulosonic acid kinase